MRLVVSTCVTEAGPASDVRQMEALEASVGCGLDLILEPGQLTVSTSSAGINRHVLTRGGSHTILLLEHTVLDIARTAVRLSSVATLEDRSAVYGISESIDKLNVDAGPIDVLFCDAVRLECVDIVVHTDLEILLEDLRRRSAGGVELKNSLTV